MRVTKPNTTDDRSASVPSFPFWFGVVTSGIWIILFVLYVSWFWQDFPSVLRDPNELGDFCAGAFAPPAFLWLVVGYLMQRNELKVYARDVAKQAEATEALAEAARTEAVRMRRQAQRVFNISFQRKGNRDGSATGHDPYAFKIRNESHNLATDVTWSVAHGKLAINEHLHRVFPAGADAWGPIVRNIAPGKILLRYRDCFGEHQHALFEFDGRTGPKQVGSSLDPSACSPTPG